MTSSSGAGAHGAPAPDAFPGGSRWLGARARNALRHPWRIGGVASAVFLLTLLALIVVPAGQRRAAERSPEVQRRLDTLPILARSHGVALRRTATERSLDSLRRALVMADSVDSAAAAQPRRGSAPTTDTIPGQVRELSRLLARAERAPLPSAYRELGGARALANVAAVLPLLDSLTDVERAQRSYGTAPGLDSGYLALTERAREIGRELSALARARRSALRGDAPEDTVVLRARLDTLTREADASERQLQLARQVNQRAVAALATARERANINAPPMAMLLAALALGLALGGAASLAIELSDPRLADSADARRVTGAPIEGELPNENSVALLEGSERLLARVINPLVPGTRLLVAAADSGRAARVAVGIATAVAASGRSVLLVDTDTGTAQSAGQLRHPATPGMSDVLGRGAGWTDVLRTHVGSHVPPLDVIPPGAPLRNAPGPMAMDDAGRQLGAIADQYDLTVLTLTPSDGPIAEALLTPVGARQAILVGAIGETRLAALRRMRERLAARGVAVAAVAVVRDD